VDILFQALDEMAIDTHLKFSRILFLTHGSHKAGMAPHKTARFAAVAFGA
jgi:hypothetical protein